MAEFLTTTGVSYRLEEIIKSATERLVIISPFLRVNERIKELLDDKNRLKIDVRVIYGKNELHPEESIWLESMTWIRTSFCKNLHAKCYLNENEALLTSMNLYEFSQINNNEMGLLVSRQEEPELYDDILQESMRIMRISEEIRVTVARVKTTENDKEHVVAENTLRRSRPNLETPKDGFCIRCKSGLPVAPAQPYCRRCYASWKRYENKEYEEKYCHVCGTEHATTLLKPLCLACYRKYKDLIKVEVS
jgi:phosphatidylserine/phosphatidylglycerophosphate/cardiolipin synthase-like enzyme